MPQISVNSGTITSFGWSANINIYQRSITFNLLPFTTGPNLTGRPVAFSVVDQDGVTLATINWTTPQIANAAATTSWVLDLSSVNFAFLFQTYAIYAAIQDSNGSVYQTNVVYVNVCQPTNLTDQGYVPGCFQITPDCVNNVLTIQEITLLAYNGLTPFGTPTKTGVLSYPTGSIGPLSFSNTPFSNNVVYTGQYNLTCTTVATYSIGNDCYVLVSYLTNNVFPITCANKMANILCCISQIEQTYLKNCNNAIGANAKQQLSDISLFVMNGLLKEISGQDSTFEVDYIQKYLGCNCGSASLSQSEFTPINPAVTSIVLNGVGGTTIPAPTTTGNTKTYNIASNVYQVVKGNTGDLAFTIAINTAISNTVQYVITFNYDTMAGYILTAISNDPTLLAQLNSLISAAGSIIGLQGSCVINTSEVNYSLSQSITGSTILTNVVINGNTYNAPANLFANNPTAVAAWLNSLTLGTFSASVTSGILTILSVANTNTPATLTFGSPNVTQAFQATSVTLVQVLQAIINYLCNLTDLQIALANNLSLCTLDYNNNVVTTTYVSGTKQSAFNAGISNAICNICSRINSLVAFTCAKLQSLFSDNPNAQFNYASDRILGIVGGACTTLTSSQVALAVINAINANQAVKTPFCAIVCTTPGTCPAISNVNFSSTSTSTIGFYGVTFSPVPSANQLVTLMYRVHGTTTWITASSNINLFPNGNINGTTPYLITGLTPGVTYDVSVGPNCGGTPFVSQVTVQPGGVLSGNYLLDNVIYAICGDSPVILYSNVPFATGTTMYTNSGLTTPVTGYTLIANTLTGAIYNINSSTGVVGTATGSNCTSGTAGTYILGNNSGTICSGGTQTLYTNGAFGVGQVLYYDSALSTPVTGFAYVVQSVSSEIFNLNSSTGVVGSYTGLSCTGNTVLITSDMVGSQVSAVSGIVGFVNTGGSFPINPGGEVTGTHGAFTGNISITITGTPSVSPSSVGLTKNNVLIQCINITAAGTYTFPSESYLATDQIAVFANGSSC
jgi:hypothetical protein